MYYNITKTYNQQLSTYPLSAETLKNFEIILTSFVEQNPRTSKKKKKISKSSALAVNFEIFIILNHLYFDIKLRSKFTFQVTLEGLPYSQSGRVFDVHLESLNLKKFKFLNFHCLRFFDWLHVPWNF